MASPFNVINRTDDAADIQTIISIAQEQQVRQIVVGLPRSMNGSLGKQAEKIEAFTLKLRNNTDVPVTFRDERLTTVSARRLMKAAGTKRAKKDARDDAIAAAIILQSYLEEGH